MTLNENIERRCEKSAEDQSDKLAAESKTILELVKSLEARIVANDAVQSSRVDSAFRDARKAIKLQCPCVSMHDQLYLPLLLQEGTTQRQDRDLMRLASSILQLEEDIKKLDGSAHPSSSKAKSRKVGRDCQIV